MQYSLNKALTLFKLGKLTGKEKNELFLLIQTDLNGPFIAKTLLFECVLTEEQEKFAYIALKNNILTVSSYFRRGLFKEGQREELFNILIRDFGELSYLLIKNVFTLDEIEKIILSIKEFEYYKDDFLNKANYHSLIIQLRNMYLKCTSKKEIFKILLKNPTILYWFLKNDEIKFNHIQKEIILKFHNKYFLSKCNKFDELILYCTWFQNFNIQTQKQKMVNTIVRKNNYSLALDIKKSINLSDDLLDIIDSLILVAKLNGQLKMII